MFLVQQQQPGTATTSFVQQQPQQVASTQQWVLQQQQGNRVVLVNAGGAGGLQYQQQAAAAQQQQYQQQQQVRLAAGGDATATNQQTVVINVNGTLQRGIVQNGAVYLLPNNGAGGGAASAPQVVSSMPQVGATLMANRGQTLTLLGQQQVQYQQQPMMVQQVLSNGQLLVPASAALVANRGVQLQAQPQPQMQARFSPMPASSMGLAPQTLMNQQQPVMLMNPGSATNMATVGRVAPASSSVAQMQARPQQQMQMPARTVPARGPVAAVGPSVLQRPAMTAGLANQTTQGFNANCVSANTASLMPRLGAAAAPFAGARPLPAGSQPMTIAAALAALPSNPPAAAAGVTATSGELASPVVPPGTPGMPVGAAAPNNSAAGTIGAVISKLAAPVREGSSAGAGTTVISGPPAAAAGISPLASQPGTPSRSNSVGQHSSTSSSSSGSGSAAAAEGEEEGKMSVMRMFARTFIETGIGLEQALSMIQASDREMLAAAFAAEAAAAVGAKAGQAAPAANPTACAEGSLASLGGEQIVMPPSQGRASEPNGLQGLSNLSVGGGAGGGAFDGEPQASTGQDSFSLGSWGFSLFSSVASDLGSTQAGSFGGHGDKVTPAGAPASATDVATASLFANLHV